MIHMAAVKLGDRGPRVRAVQRALNKLGAKLEIDGKFGPKTLAAGRGFVTNRTQDRLPDWLVGVIEDAADVVSESSALAPTPSKGIRWVGAWCGSASLANPKRDVRFAVDHNINRLDIIVNDHSKARDPTKFTIRNEDKIARLCGMATDAGLSVHLMSWIMPHAAYIERAAEALVPLVARVGASSLQWDAEEPWMKAKKRMRYPDAAALIKAAFSGLPAQMGVNGIGYASVAKLGPLAAVCDYTVPQAYVTKSSGLDPRTAPGKFYRRWNDKFERPVVMGLAACRQTGIPGYTAEAAMQAAVDATRDLDVDTIIYWSLRWLRKSPRVAKVVSEIRAAQ